MAFLFIVQTPYENLFIPETDASDVHKQDKDEDKAVDKESDPSTTELGTDKTIGDGEAQKVDVNNIGLQPDEHKAEDSTNKGSEVDPASKGVSLTSSQDKLSIEASPAQPEGETDEKSSKTTKPETSFKSQTSNNDLEAIAKDTRTDTNLITAENGKSANKSNDDSEPKASDTKTDTNQLGVEQGEDVDKQAKNDSSEELETDQEGEKVGRFTVTEAEEQNDDANTETSIKTGRFTVTPKVEAEDADTELPDDRKSVKSELSVRTNGDKDTASIASVKSGSPSKSSVGKNTDEGVTENSPGECTEQLGDNNPLTPLIKKIPLHQEVANFLVNSGIDNVHMEVIGNGKYRKFSFVLEDSRECEKVLVKLNGMGVGVFTGSAVSIFPSSIHKSFKIEEDTESRADDLETTPPDKRKDSVKVNEFMKSIKSRMVVDQVVETVGANAKFTFDYLLLLILASLIACVGLVENSSVVLVASMLISPLMGPILAATFGQQIRNYELRNLGIKSEIRGLALCLIVGFTFGLISGGVGLHGAVWGSTDEWPTSEMTSRGMSRSLWVGVMIAIPSGAGVALSVLGGNAGSLVGVAISASLLPPACNAGMLWAYALLTAIKSPAVQPLASVAIQTTAQTVLTTLATNIVSNATTISSNSTNILTNRSTFPPSTAAPPVTQPIYPPGCPSLINNNYKPIYYCNVSHDAGVLGCISILLTIINIFCIMVMGVIVLKVKEVAPDTVGVEKSQVDRFFKEDIDVARTYYITQKGKKAANIGKQFMEEWKKIKMQEKQDREKNKEALERVEEGDSDLEDEGSLTEPMQTMEMVNYIADVENSPETRDVLSFLPHFKHFGVAAGLEPEYNRAAQKVSSRLSKIPEVYLTEKRIKDKHLERVHQTIHHLPTRELVELRRLGLRRRVMSSHFDSVTLEEANKPRAVQSDTSVVSGVENLNHKKSKLFHRRQKQGVRFKPQSTLEEEQSLV